MEASSSPEFNGTSMALWRALALHIVHDLARTNRAFSTDEVWRALEALPKPPDPRALGPVMTAARSSGLVAKSALVVTSIRPECHSRPVSVWLSVPLHATMMNGAEYVAARSRTVTLPLFGANATPTENREDSWTASGAS